MEEWENKYQLGVIVFFLLILGTPLAVLGVKGMLEPKFAAEFGWITSMFGFVTAAYCSLLLVFVVRKIAGK